MAPFRAFAGQQMLAYDLGMQHDGRDGNSPIGEPRTVIRPQRQAQGALFADTPRCPGAKAGQAAGRQSLITGDVKRRSAAMISPSWPASLSRSTRTAGPARHPAGRQAYRSSAHTATVLTRAANSNRVSAWTGSGKADRGNGRDNRATKQPQL